LSPAFIRGLRDDGSGETKTAELSLASAVKHSPLAAKNAQKVTIKLATFHFDNLALRITWNLHPLTELNREVQQD
jgi:hypothetical protein